MTESDTSIIPGLHFFCDHRCWRCPMTHRCQVPRQMAQTPESRARRGSGPAGRVAEVVMASLYVTVEQVGTMLECLPGQRLSLLPAVPAGPGVQADQERRSEDIGRKAECDPLVAKGKEYASGTLRVLQTLKPKLGRLEDAAMSDAAERLEETCLTVASKIHRAVSSSLEPDSDPLDSQSDSNGSAKVALLLIEESRQAWRALMQPGRAIGNGAPARFVRLLDGLEGELNERFPHAVEFVRPGFDTVAEGVH